MKLIACADLHITEKKPKYRSDQDYLDTGINKFMQIINLANKKGLDIVCAGDLVDHYSVSHKTVNKILACLNELHKDFYLVLGQHDVPHHNFDIEKSPIGTLLAADKVVLLDHRKLNGMIGMGFGDTSIPHVTGKNNILVVHTTITRYDPPEYLVDAIPAEYALEEAFKEFRVVIAGDFHEAYFLKTKDQLLVNCGPMMRKNIDQINVKPCVWEIDTVKLTAKQHYLKIKDDVFNYQLAEHEKKKKTSISENMKELINVLKTQSKAPKIEDTAKEVMKKSKTKEEVKAAVNFYLSGEYDE
jgi:DNA repair exonuclease SbcCD nuclease subunit